MSLPIHSLGHIICQSLQDEGFHSVFVGGAVRDACLGNTPVDIDIATAANPTDIESLFASCKATGKSFGTITVLMQETPFQVTSFRSDGTYSDSRHPDSVVFESCLEADLARRDFTVNAMGYDPVSDTLTDIFSGQSHLKQRLLVTVGDARTRFEEDSLRLFRACRFMSQLNFSCDETTRLAVTELSPNITLPSKERYSDELRKLLHASDPLPGLELGIQSGLFSRILPGIDQISSPVLKALKKDAISSRLARLIQHCDKDACFQLLSLTKKERQWISRLIQYNLDIQKASFTLKDLQLSGKAIQEMGFYGEEIGAVQRFLHECVLADFSINTPEQLQQMVKTKFLS